MTRLIIVSSDGCFQFHILTQIENQSLNNYSSLDFKTKILQIAKYLTSACSCNRYCLFLQNNNTCFQK